MGDITDKKIQEKLINETVKQFGRLDVLVNNAGSGMQASSTAQCPIDTFDEIFNINVRSTQLALPHLVRSKGNIVNLSSVNAMKAYPMWTYYNMAKIPVDHYMRCLAVELGPRGVRTLQIRC